MDADTYPSENISWNNIKFMRILIVVKILVKIVLNWCGYEFGLNYYHKKHYSGYDWFSIPCWCIN